MRVVERQYGSIFNSTCNVSMTETTRQFEIAFRVFDDDNSGYISVSEFRKVRELVVSSEVVQVPYSGWRGYHKREDSQGKSPLLQ